MFVIHRSPACIMLARKKTHADFRPALRALLQDRTASGRLAHFGNTTAGLWILTETNIFSITNFGEIAKYSFILST